MIIGMSVLTACVVSPVLASLVLAAETSPAAAASPIIKGQFVDLPGAHLCSLDNSSDGTSVASAPIHRQALTALEDLS